jgi:hypothetical protein
VRELAPGGCDRRLLFLFWGDSILRDDLAKLKIYAVSLTLFVLGCSNAVEKSSSLGEFENRMKPLQLFGEMELKLESIVDSVLIQDGLNPSEFRKRYFSNETHYKVQILPLDTLVLGGGSTLYILRKDLIVSRIMHSQ